MVASWDPRAPLELETAVKFTVSKVIFLEMFDPEQCRYMLHDLESLSFIIWRLAGIQETPLELGTVLKSQQLREAHKNFENTVARRFGLSVINTNTVKPRTYT